MKSIKIITLSVGLFAIIGLYTGCSKESAKIEVKSSTQETAVNKETVKDTVKDTEVEYLMVQNSDDVKLTENKLTLIGVSPTTIFFSDRPKRIVGHVDNNEVASVWTEGSDELKADPPNATLSILGEKELVELVVELTNPKSEGNNYTYDMKILDGTIPEFTGPATLFIDPVGMPRTPVSVGGVARRTTRRVVAFH